MKRIPLSKKQIVKLKKQNEEHLDTVLKKLFAMIPGNKAKVVK